MNWIKRIFSKKVEKQCAIDSVSIRGIFGENRKFRYISPKTKERHTKEFETMAEAFYWGVQNLDIELEWQIVEDYEC